MTTATAARVKQEWATADMWARAVVSGEVKTNAMIRKACQRHLNDLERSDIWFEEAKANKAIGIFQFLKQRKGRWANQPLTLEPCQLFIVGSLFGWMRADGTRRFRVGYVEVPRKFGKSTLAAGVADYLAFFDGEPGAETYCTATKKDQAKIVWEEAKWQLSNAIPAFKTKGGYTVQAHNIHNASTSSKLLYIGADEDSTDGLNPHGVICDEIHAWKSEEFLGKLETAGGARTQPMRFMITTAGTQTSTLYLSEHAYAVSVVNGTYEDDSWFVFVSCADDPEKWEDEEQWIIANPNVGVTVSLDFLRDEYRRARVSPTKQSMFKRMYLGIITSSAESWLMSETLDAQASTEGPPEAGRTFVGGLDLSSIRDLTAFIQWFQDDDGDGGEIVARFYMPRENLQARVDEDRVPYDVWADDGWITLTDGRTVDYEFIIRDIEEQCEVYPARSFGIDPWNGQQVRTALESAGFLVVKVPQSHIRLDSCVNEGERLLQNGRVRGFHNPVLRWMFLNAVVNMNAHKLRKLDKLASPEKIDGAVAWLNALSEAMGVEADETMGAGWL